MFPRFGTSQRANGLVEPRGRLFGLPARTASEQEETPAISVTRAMEILEMIAERKTQHFGTTLGFADRIQLLP